MIYRYGYLRREALALLCCGVAVCLVTATGCVDHRYDLKGDLVRKFEVVNNFCKSFS